MFRRPSLHDRDLAYTIEATTDKRAFRGQLIKNGTYIYIPTYLTVFTLCVFMKN
jgi:hypothetical protein